MRLMMFVCKTSRPDFGSHRIEECGFQVLEHESTVAFPEKIDETDLADVEAYKVETEKLLKDNLEAKHVVCYDFRLRENKDFSRNMIDLGNPLLIEGPAYGAHNDESFLFVFSIPVFDDKALNLERQYLKPGYRFQIVNTWRILNPVAQDNPLALCDFRTVIPEDLIEADRVSPGRAGEVYYIKDNKSQRWCWLEGQTPNEPFVFVMYDTKPGNQARYRPHITFQNSRAPDEAPPRKSVETRSIVTS
ncbi:hypothetical protein B0J14DRAFT_707346 [Halenospora varia]|nr:hypothetical protein B0J14DRAFT_707346 [Halenospora varia]